MTNSAAQDRNNPVWLIRSVILGIATLIVLVVLFLIPRYQQQMTTVDGAHRWSNGDAPPQRQIVWQPATPMTQLDSLPPTKDSRIRPQLSDDGNTLFFTIRTEDDQYNIVQSRRVGGEWSPPQAVSELNSTANEIGPVIRADGQVLYLYSDREGGYGGMDLYVSRWLDDRWSKPRNLGPRVNSPAHEYDPAISPDGLTLYFSSNRSASMHRRMAVDDFDPATDHWTTTLRTDLGNRTFDLYAAELDSSTSQWAHAAPIDELNTSQFNEGAPFVSADGAFLVFVSDRPHREGESRNYDIYRARIDNQPLLAENLGAGINSPANEIEPSLDTAGFQIVFSRSLDKDASRYALFQSTAKEVYHDRQWESSRWQAFTSAIASGLRSLVDRFWWILLFLALLAALAWFVRQLTLRRIAIPGFLLAALLIHFLLVTSSFYVFFQEQISDRLRKMFEEETVIASQVLLPATAPSLDEQPKFDQVADLEMPESDQPAEVSKRPTETARATIDPVELAMPQMPAKLSPDSSAEVVVATVFVQPKTVDPQQPLARRRPQSTVSQIEPVLLEETVAVDSPQVQPIESITPQVPVQSLEIVEPTVRPMEAQFDQRESLSTAVEAEKPPELIASETPLPAISIDRAQAPRAPSQPDEDVIPSESIVEAVVAPTPAPQAKSVDLSLPRESVEPAIAQPEPIELLVENRSAPKPVRDDSAQRVIAENSALAANNSLPDAPLLRSRMSPRLAEATTQSARIVVPVGQGESVEENHPLQTTSVDVARQTIGDVSVQLQSASVEAVSSQAMANNVTEPGIEPLLPTMVAAVPLSIPGTLPPRRSLKVSDAYADSNVNLRSLLQRRKLDESEKSEIIKQFGGNDQTLAAIRQGLTWIEQHQHSDGHWGLHDFHTNCKGHKRCNGQGGSHADTAGTGLALLPFLGDGNTHKQGPHQELVARGITWLVTHQKPDGDLFTGGQDIAWMYSHAIATIALCECYGMSGDAKLRGPAQRAIDFIVAAQDPKSGGWRYRPRQDSDTSVVGWQVMALKSGQMAELNVPEKSLEEAQRWLTSVAGANGKKGQYGYQRGRFSLTMTAEALLCIEYLGAQRDHDQLRDGTDFLLANLPKKNRESSYFWYYGTQAMFHLQGEPWQKWNQQLHPLLIESQQKKGPLSGTWDAKDQWEKSGGRIYSTSLRLLMLEVYYRHLPLYRVIQ